MSYDLYFHKKNDRKLNDTDISEYFTSKIPFLKSEGESQWLYENIDTNVYFIVNRDRPETDNESFNDLDNHQGFRYTGLSCNINFLRPDFFGREIFPIIDQIKNDLDLYIINPQDENDPENPQKFPDGYLQEQWTTQNRKLSVPQFEKLELSYLSSETSNYIWEYQLQRQKLQEKLGEQIFVPKYFILKSYSDNKLYTACAWPFIPTILPPVDFVVVFKEYKKFLWTVKENGIVPYKTILSEFVDSFEDFNDGIQNLKILKPTKLNGLDKKFNSIEVGKEPNEFGVYLALDGYVNVRP